MSKKLVIRLAISIIFVAFVYVLFWFFKIGQLEKKVSKFISDNNAYITSGSIESYGFPLSQNIIIKDIKFSIPNPIFSKRQISISELTATSGIFANSFAVTLSQGVSTQNDKGEIARVKFNSEPKIHISIPNSDKVEMSYSDSGYSMHDPKKNLVLAAKSSQINISVDSNDKNNIKVSINTNIKEVEGFDVVDVYNNILRKDIVKGIQTGKIKIGSSRVFNDEAPIIDEEIQEEIPAVQITDSKEEINDLDLPVKEQSEELEEKDSSNSIDIPELPEVSEEKLKAQIVTDSKDKVAVSKLEIPNIQINDDEDEIMEVEQLAQSDEMQVIVEESSEEDIAEDVSEDAVESDPVVNVKEAIKAEPTIEKTKLPVAASNLEDSGLPVEAKNALSPVKKLKEEELGLKNKYTQGVKSNLKIDLVYILTPNNLGDQLDLPFDPTKIQELPVQYNKEIKINNLEFSNQDYQILANGSLSLVADDTLPSGNLSLTIKNHANFINYLKDYVKFDLSSKGYDLNPVKMAATEIVANEIELKAAIKNDEIKEVEEPVNDLLLSEEEEITAPVEVQEEEKIIEPEVVKELVIKDGYDKFLKKMYDRLTEVSSELSEKNPATTNEESRYEIKREKNLEFKINNTPIREVLGKF